MRKCLLIILFLLIFCIPAHAHDNHDEPIIEKKYEFRRDFPERFNLKFNERINNSSDYIILKYYLDEGFFNEPEQFRTFRFAEIERLKIKIGTDFEDSTFYAGSDFFLRSNFGKKLRRIFIIITKVEIVRDAEQEKIKISGSAILEKKEQTQEEIRRQENELASLSGNSMEIEKKKENLKKEIDSLKAKLAEEHRFRWKLGMDIKPLLASPSKIEKSGIEIKPFGALQISNSELAVAYLRSHNFTRGNEKEEARINIEQDFPKKEFYPSFRYTHNLLNQTNILGLKLKKRFSSKNLILETENKHVIEEKTNRTTFSADKIFPKSVLRFNTKSDWKKEYSIMLNLSFQF